MVPELVLTTTDGGDDDPASSGTTESALASPGYGPGFDTSPRDVAITQVATAWRNLRRSRSNSAVRQQLNATSAGVLDLGQVDTLHLLAEAGELRMSELADRLRVDASTATRAAQRLVDAGFATRRPDEEDRRGVVMVITDSGRDTQLEIVGRARRLLEWLAAGFTDPELLQLGELMSRFVDRIDASLCVDLDGPEPRPPTPEPGAPTAGRDTTTLPNPASRPIQRSWR